MTWTCPIRLYARHADHKKRGGTLAECSATPMVHMIKPKPNVCGDQNYSGRISVFQSRVVHFSLFQIITFSTY